MRQPSSADDRAQQILSIENVEVTYKTRTKSVTALEGLWGHLGEGEFVSVLGPSGCGKSTLLKLAAGLITPTRGALRLDGETITGPRGDVGVVFQQPTLLPWQTALENVLFPIRALGWSLGEYTERAHQLLALVGLANFADSYPAELSGGMQQRVGIARGLIHRPRLLLMDEPFAALDAMTREYMMVKLQRIWMSQNCSIVFITHSIPEAVFLADRVVVLSARPGRTVRELEIDLPRPRDLATLTNADFNAICHDLRQFFSTLVTDNLE